MTSLRSTGLILGVVLGLTVSQTSQVMAATSAELDKPPTKTPRHHSKSKLILVTGDSMVQGLDLALAKRLKPRGLKVRSDAHISTGISKPRMLNWPELAVRQAKSQRPRATVVLIGANDGFALRTANGKLVNCCGPAWGDAYAKRVRHMMRSYSRAGKSYVYWLLLPQTRAGFFFHRVYPVVNRAIMKAARREGGVVRTINLYKIFTPGGKYRDYMRWGGRTARVRESDGIHLTMAGSEIVAGVVVKAMRRDSLLAKATRTRRTKGARARGKCLAQTARKPANCGKFLPPSKVSS